jgi:hypothetical protein
MKTKSILIVLLSTALLYSCQVTELEFSCDPVINNYVLNNKVALSQITVVECSTYDITLQRAIFNSWSAEKKRDAWINKLNYILKNEKLNTLETIHLQKLITHVEPGYFSNENGLDDQKSKFASDWINYASDELKWTGEFIAFIVYRLYVDQTQFDAEISILYDLGLVASTNSEGSCNCATSSDFCGTYTCQDSGCSSVSSGCGWLWMESCNGSCY